MRLALLITKGWIPGPGMVGGSERSSIRPPFRLSVLMTKWIRVRDPFVHLLRGGLVGLMVAGLAAGCWAGWLQQTGNLHVVLADQIYRSAQPSGAQLDNWTARHGFRSVLNLRGASDADWYRIERATAARLNLRHADFDMRDSAVLTPERAADLIALLEALPKPVLIHCKAGADRTGLAAALYLARMGYPEALAEAQISFRYGHVSLPVSAAWPMDQSWEAMEPSFGYDS